MTRNVYRRVIKTVLSVVPNIPTSLLSHCKFKINILIYVLRVLSAFASEFY